MPDKLLMQGTGVIHGYDKVDDVVMWGIITIHLPKLEEEVKIIKRGINKSATFSK